VASTTGEELRVINADRDSVVEIGSFYCDEVLGNQDIKTDVCYFKKTKKNHKSKMIGILSAARRCRVLHMRG
jgi:hypothetical protein